MHISNKLPNLWDVLEICSKSVTLLSDDFNSLVFQYTLYLSSLHHLFLVFCFGLCFFFPPKNSFLLAFLDLVGSFVLLLYFMLPLRAVLEQILAPSPILFSFMTLLAGNVLGLKLTVLLVCDLSTAFGARILPLQCFK